jgi:hypothetical protein
MTARPYHLFRAPLIALSLLSLRCEHAGPLEPAPLPDVPTLTEVQASIFDVSCAVPGCHAGANPLMGLDLTAGAAFANLVNVPSVVRRDLMLVAPGKPDSSYLVAKIEGSALIGTTLRMPLGRDPLSTEAIEAVRAWIEAGAKND